MTDKPTEAAAPTLDEPAPIKITLTPSELAELIEEDKQRRAEAARADIAAACARHRVRLVGTMSIIGERVETGVLVEPL